MPPATKRRKLSATTTSSLTGPAVQRGIQAFGKISKSQVQDPGKVASGKNSTVTHSKDDSNSGNSNKRKLGSIGSPTDNEEGEKVLSLSEQARIIEDSSKSPAQRLAGQFTSTSNQTNHILPSSLAETPKKGARSCRESLGLASSSPSESSSSSHATNHEKPSSFPASAQIEWPHRYDSHRLPDELKDLVSLHSSFLTTLSLHYAHNGSMTPADLRNLGPGIERAWRKRKVTLDDVRRILAIERPKGDDGQEKAGPLGLSDYGNGKICVEVADHTDTCAATRRPVNEKVLKTLFLRGLEQRWMCYKIDNPAGPSPSDFIASLALLPITPCTSLSKITTLFSKGQRRLEDLKAGAIRAQQKPLSITSANPTSLPRPTTKQISARSTDLFARLKAKQLHQSTLPLPPSAEALARRSALQRLQEITPVLESLANSSKKHDNEDAAAAGIRPIARPVSFTMPTLVQHLQMSLRKPIGKEEARRSIKVLAELAPEWVELKEMGRMLGVTIKGTRLTKDEIRRRVESLPANP